MSSLGGLTLVGLGVNYWLMIPLVCLFGIAQGALASSLSPTLILA